MSANTANTANRKTRHLTPYLLMSKKFDWLLKRKHGVSLHARTLFELAQSLELDSQHWRETNKPENQHHWFDFSV